MKSCVRGAGEEKAREVTTEDTIIIIAIQMPVRVSMHRYG